jgi:TolB-like protein
MSPMWMIAIVLTLAVTILTVGLLTNGNRVPAEAASVPGVVVLPFEHYTTDPQEALLVARLTDAITVELAQVGGLSVSSRTTAARYANSAEPLTSIAKALNVDFIVEASVVSHMDQFDLTVRLVDGRLDRKVWVGEYAVPRSNMATPAQIAADIAAAVQQLQRP